MPRKILVFALIACLALTVVGCNKADQQEEVAIVNGQVIIKAQLQKRLEQTAAMNGFDLNDPQLADYVDIYELQVLEGLIDELLLKLEAANLGLEVTNDEVQQEIDFYKSQFSSEKEYKDYFNNHLKMSEADVQDLLKNQVLLNKLFDEITQEINSPEVDLKEYYNQNKEQFYEEEKVRARHILVKTQEEAEKLIKAITEEGQDMAELATIKSIDPTAQENQGDLGYFTRGRMVEAFEEAAFALKIDEITSEPVQTIHGFHIIRVEDRAEAQQLPFETIKEQLEEDLIYEAKNKYFYHFMEELRDEVEITNKLEEEYIAKQQRENEADDLDPEENNEQE